MSPLHPDNDDHADYEEPDSYFENGMLVFTAAFHLKRGHCCGSGCRHCPYEPKHVEGNTQTGRTLP
jgi:hypothetical protein